MTYAAKSAAKTIATILIGASLSSIALASDPAHPAVVELYQSQGCSSCPPADAAVNAIAGRPDVLALSFAVTYWDQLGWKDTFGSPAYTARQWDYSRAAGRGNVSTPQVIVNGRQAIVGSNPAQLAQTIARNDRGNGGPAIALQGGKIMVSAAPTRQTATVWLVRYDPRTIPVPIRAGENGGRTIAHRNIVRGLMPLGQWTGKATSFAMPAVSGPYRTAVLVQSGKGGAIVAASRL